MSERPFTFEKPTIPGLYLYKPHQEDVEAMAIVSSWMDRLCVSTNNVDWVFLEDCDGLWHGPVEPKVTRRKKDAKSKKFLKIKDYPDSKRSLVWLMEKQGSINAFYMAAELPTWKADDLSAWFESVGVKTVREESKLESPKNTIIEGDDDEQDQIEEAGQTEEGQQGVSEGAVAEEA